MEWIYEWVTRPEAWVALGTLTVLEVVLGIDNILFLSILTDRLPEEERPRARRIGLFLAMGMRVALLFSLSALTRLTDPLFHLPFLDEEGSAISPRDLILLGGGLFLVWKSATEIFHKVEGKGHEPTRGGRSTFQAVLIQVVLLDLVFSLDSVITAVGMANDLAVMVLAVMISVVVMVVYVDVLCAFVDRHPSLQVLALSFLTVVGVTLICESIDIEVPKGAVYFAMAFSFGNQLLAMRMHKQQET
ncbi:MAG: TerC family protein [Planctomycetota bacterium]